MKIGLQYLVVGNGEAREAIHVRPQHVVLPHSQCLATPGGGITQFPLCKGNSKCHVYTSPPVQPRQSCIRQMGPVIKLFPVAGSFFLFTVTSGLA